MHRLTNHMSRRRWSSVNEVAPEAMKSLQVVKVKIRSASTKTRAANINGLETAGLGEGGDVWMGVLPVYEVLGDPIDSGYGPDRSVQREILDWKERRNSEEKSYAERVARVPIEGKSSSRAAARNK